MSIYGAVTIGGVFMSKAENPSFKVVQLPTPTEIVILV